ncbi:MAG: SCO family protein [Chloroflexi bacterium]|nr:SCO family protein [Chloroflexota bacterium]
MEADISNPRLNTRRGLLKLALIGISVLLAAAVVAVVSIRLLSSSDEANELPIYWELPAFSFTDQLGRPVSSEGLRGKVILANFVFTNCTAFCPTVLTPHMSELQERLRGEGLLGPDVMLLSFSVDPEQDTPEVLRAYAEKYGADPEVWRFLTGSVDEMERVVTTDLKLGFQKIEQPVEHTHPDGSAHTHKYDVTHTNRFTLVDGQGQVRALYDGVYDWNLDKVLSDVRQLAEQRS